MTGAPREAYASQDFIIISKSAVRELGGDWGLAGCFQRIAWRSQRDGCWRATMAEIADEICVSERTAKRLTSKLRELGWIASYRENTWESTLTWKPVWRDESANVALPAEGDETAGQAAEGQGDTDESAKLAPSGVPEASLSEEAKLAPSQEAKLAPSPFSQTAKTKRDTADQSAAAIQPALDGMPDGASSTPTIGTPGEHLGDPVARWWWDQLEPKPVTAHKSERPFIHVQRICRGAIDKGWTQKQIHDALLAIGKPKPTAAELDQRLRNMRDGVIPMNRRVAGSTNVHRLPDSDPQSVRLQQRFGSGS